MPLFMDFYINSNKEISIEELIRKYMSDLTLQYRYGVEFKSLWVSEDTGIVFCLMEGPDRDSCTKAHQEVYGNMASHIIEVRPGEFYRFRTSSTANHRFAEIEKDQHDPEYLTVLQFEKIGPIKDQRFSINNIKQLITSCDGTILIDPHRSTKGVFVHPASAIMCACHIKYLMEKIDPTLDYRIAIVAGKSANHLPNKLNEYETTLSEKLLKSGFKGSIRTTQLTRNLLYKENGASLGYLKDIDVLSPNDEQFLFQLLEIIENNYRDPDFNSNSLTTLFGLSRSQLFRKVKRLTGYTPNLLVREVRLYEAFKLLNQDHDRISQIAYNTGFNSPSYFAKVFVQRFQILPSEYR